MRKRLQFPPTGQILPYLAFFLIMLTALGGAAFCSPVSWVAVEDGPTNGFDRGNAVTTDSAGNIYVAGYIEDDGQYDYAVVKYSPSGAKQWRATYDGPDGGLDDYATAIAVDSAGNVYVTGESVGGVSGFDIATLKFSSSGVQQWAVRYNDDYDDDDGGVAIAVDSVGNVYVTGYAMGEWVDEFITIKYNTNGNQQWVSRYAGTSSFFGSYAKDIAVDASGNVYVTGVSYDGATGNDYVTVKYDSSGNQQWASRYIGIGNDGEDNPAQVVVDAGGYVYVTGKSDSSTSGFFTNFDYATVKYSPSGAVEWSRRYDSVENKDDFATGLTVDASGNVYVTGGSYIDTNGNDIVTIKYNAVGDQIWIDRHNPGDDDSANSIALDHLGNVCVSGYTRNQLTGYDVRTLKYDPSGAIVWAVSYDGIYSDTDVALSVATDPTGNVIVAGRTTKSGVDTDILTIRYDGCGPSGSVVINNDDAVTTTPVVSLALSAIDSDGAVDEMRFSNDGSSWTSWETYGTSKSWTLTSGDGTKTVYVQFKDYAGNISSSYTDSIILDASGPTGSVSINGGAAYTATESVTLDITAQDTGTGVSEMRFSNDNSNWSAWESFAITKNWTLASGSGLKTVYVQFKDGLGNESDAFSDTIGLGAPISIGQAKASVSGSFVILAGKTVTAVFPNSFYIQEPYIGIRVDAAQPVSVGDVVDISGSMLVTSGFEKAITPFTLKVNGTAAVNPTGMPCKAVGGSNWMYDQFTGAGQRGITGVLGLNNIGLLIKIWGKVKTVDSSNPAMWFIMDDGSKGDVKVIVPSGVSVPSVNQVVKVVGISSCELAEPELDALVRVRSQSDIVIN